MLDSLLYFLLAFLLCFAIAKYRALLFQLLNHLFDWFWYRNVIKPFLVALPGAVLACYSIEEVKHLLPEMFKWVQNNLLDMTIGYFFVPLFVGIEEWVRKAAYESSSNLPSEGQVLLLKSLDNPVDMKKNRFLSELTKVNQGHTYQRRIDVFKSITVPERQLAEITRAIHVFFEGLARLLGSEDVEFTTVLFRIENGRPVDSYCYFLESGRPDDELLSDPDSLAANTVKNGKMIIIQDIKKRRRRGSLKFLNFVSPKRVRRSAFRLNIKLEKAFLLC